MLLSNLTEYSFCVFIHCYKITFTNQIMMQVLILIIFIYYFSHSRNALFVGLVEDNTIPTKPPISKQQSSTQEKQETINQRAFSETILPLK